MDFNKLPKTTGVYFFYETNKNPIYIGKAVNIQSRVKNHKDFFMPKVKKVKYIETNSEIDALLLEANLIKKHQPKYNVMWRDDKNYFYVCIAKNKQKIPYIFITHQPDRESRSMNHDSRFIIQSMGPFVEGTALKNVLKYLRRVFPYYTSSKHPKIKCTWCHLNLCPGPQPNLKLYKNNIKKLILILQGKRNRVLSSLQNEMKKLSKEAKYEEAGKIRDQISALQQVMSHTLGNKSAYAQLLSTTRIECYDISNIQGKFATGSMVVFINGQPAKSEYKKFKIKLSDTPNDIAMLKEVISRRLNHTEWVYPDMMLIDGGRAQLNAAIACKSKFLISNFKSNTKSQISKIKIISIAKGRQELFIEGQKLPILLKNIPQETQNLILQLDEEAHRFAITYHKKLRKNNLLS